MKTCNKFNAYAAPAALALLLTASGCNNRKEADHGKSSAPAAEAAEQSRPLNQLTETEKQEGWTLLFDGKTSKGWTGTRNGKFPEKGWVIRDGVLSMEPGDDQHAGGDIITTGQYDDFKLSLEFRIPEGANSGIKYFVVDDYPGHAGSFLGLEYQILDDERHPDAKNGVKGNRTAASLYDLIPAKNKKMVIGEWNRARIVSLDNHVEHWLNGNKVVEFERGSKEYKALIAESKYKEYENFGEVPRGHILLQAHGNPVHFRNIKIKEL